MAGLQPQGRTKPQVSLVCSSRREIGAGIGVDGIGVGVGGGGVGVGGTGVGVGDGVGVGGTGVAVGSGVGAGGFGVGLTMGDTSIRGAFASGGLQPPSNANRQIRAVRVLSTSFLDILALQMLFP